MKATEVKTTVQENTTVIATEVIKVTKKITKFGIAIGVGLFQGIKEAYNEQ